MKDEADNGDGTGRKCPDQEKGNKMKLSFALTDVMHMKKKQRIFCLDGGGIRGVMHVELLLQIEEPVGRKITELFDLITETSTIGILVLVYGERKFISDSL